MLSFAFRRLLSAIPTLLVLIALAFALIRVAPGGPFDVERQLPPQIEARMNAAYHLDEPLPQQFVRYLGNLLQGDFGPRTELYGNFKFGPSFTNESADIQNIGTFIERLCE